MSETPVCPDYSPDADDSEGLLTLEELLGLPFEDPGSQPEVFPWKGPPGTGKTELLATTITGLVDQGVSIERIGLMPFSNAAVDQARLRLTGLGGFSRTELRNVRTLHSAACSQVKVDQANLMTDARRAMFRSEVVPSLGGQDGKRYDSIVDRGRARGLTVQELPAIVTRTEARHIDGRLLERYYAAYTQHLIQHRLLTFDDVLRQVLASQNTVTPLVPDIDYLFVDEAQDLSPLGAAVIDFWASHCKALYVAGDDDQAIYGFAGGDGTWFKNLFRKYDGKTLEQSHRVPRRVHEVATKVISQVKDRLDVPYLPTSSEGEVIRGVTIAQLPKLLDGKDNLVLARDGWALGDVKQVLTAAGRLFTETSGTAGRTDRQLAVMVETIQVLARGFVVPAAALCPVVERRGRADEVVLLDRLRGLRGSLIDQNKLVELGAGGLLLDLAAGPLAVLDSLTKREKQVVGVRLGLGQSAPDITLSTIHAIKGGQADVVAIIPDRSRSSFEAAESDPQVNDDEHRLLYVGMTRARRRLILLEPTNLQRAFMAFRFPPAGAL